jgi:hypothetical protein
MKWRVEHPSRLYAAVGVPPTALALQKIDTNTKITMECLQQSKECILNFQ